MVNFKRLFIFGMVLLSLKPSSDELLQADSSIVVSHESPCLFLSAFEKYTNFSVSQEEFEVFLRESVPYIQDLVKECFECYSSVSSVVGQSCHSECGVYFVQKFCANHDVRFNMTIILATLQTIFDLYKFVLQKNKDKQKVDAGLKGTPVCGQACPLIHKPKKVSGLIGMDFSFSDIQFSLLSEFISSSTFLEKVRKVHIGKRYLYNIIRAFGFIESIYNDSCVYEVSSEVKEQLQGLEDNVLMHFGKISFILDNLKRKWKELLLVQKR